MSTMETRRYYNPATLITETVTLAYAAVTGLVPWDAEDNEVETVNGVERAVMVREDFNSMLKDELIIRADDLGLLTSGTRADIIARIEAKLDAIAASPDVPCIGCPPKGGTEPVPVASPTTLHSNSADGEDKNTSPQKEG